MKSLAGLTISDSNKQNIVEAIRKAILNFEPRIYSGSLKVGLMKSADGNVECTTAHKIKISISGALRPLQKKERIFVKTEIDLETGRFELVA
jgi:predicted component of type VI protein secretion system